MSCSLAATTTTSDARPERVGLARTTWRRYLRTRSAVQAWWTERCRLKCRSLILQTAPGHVDPKADIEIHSLTCERDYPDLLWCLKTFFHYSGRRCDVVLHDDGSLSPEAYGHLQRHLPGATIISKARADERMHDVMAPYPTSRAFRDRLPLARRLFDVPVFATRKQFVILDSDVLFFGRPDEILKSLDRGRLCFMSDYQDGYVYPRSVIAARYGVDIVPAFNTGVCALAKDVFDSEFIEHYCQGLGPAGLERHPWAEQTLFGLLLSRHKERADRLSARYRISRTPLDSDTISHHFVNDGSRGLFYTRGIPYLQKTGFLTDHAAANRGT